MSIAIINILFEKGDIILNIFYITVVHRKFTLEEVENINLNNYNFKPFREIMKGSNKNEN